MRKNVESLKRANVGASLIFGFRISNWEVGLSYKKFLGLIGRWLRILEDGFWILDARCRFEMNHISIFDFDFRLAIAPGRKNLSLHI